MTKKRKLIVTNYDIDKGEITVKVTKYGITEDVVIDLNSYATLGEAIDELDHYCENLSNLQSLIEEMKRK